MKLVTFEAVAGTRKIGALSDDVVIDLSDIVGSDDMNVLIDKSTDLHDAITATIAEKQTSYPVADVTLLAPIPAIRRNIYCVGKNYHEHAKEFASSGYDSSASAGSIPLAPIVFSKPSTAVSGPNDVIDTSLDPFNSVDYEAELAVVIGKAGRVEENDDPWSFVFGYTLINDVTARELQKKHSQWLLGKGIDGYAPMGPAIVTADEFGVVGEQVISCEVNGEVRQSSPLSSLIFDIPTLIKTIGRSISFVPGDIIATGTPAGVGIGFNPAKYLKPGDVVTVKMTEIGVLENTVI